MGYLDKNGLDYLWGKIKAALSGKQNVIAPLTQAEYNALPDKENSGFCIITDAAGSVGAGGSSGEAYSTEEQVIGTWIDGRPLYRRVFEGVLPSSTNFATLPNSKIENLDKIVSWNGGVNTKDGVYKTAIEHVDSSAYITTLYDLNKNGLRVRTTHSAYFDAWIYLVVKYTKTTDAEVSG